MTCFRCGADGEDGDAVQVQGRKSVLLCRRCAEHSVPEAFGPLCGYPINNNAETPCRRADVVSVYINYARAAHYRCSLHDPETREAIEISNRVVVPELRLTRRAFPRQVS